MTDLTDFKRLVHEPLEKQAHELRKTITFLSRRLIGAGGNNGVSSDALVAAAATGSAVPKTRARTTRPTSVGVAKRTRSPRHTFAVGCSRNSSRGARLSQRRRPNVAGNTHDAASLRPATLAVCACGAPLIGTFHWRGHEWYCIECGRRHTFFGCPSAPTTDALWARYEALRAEWDEHAGPKLLTMGARHEGCPKCWGDGSEDHERHATDEERAAHEEATAWLKARVAS